MFRPTRPTNSRPTNSRPSRREGGGPFGRPNRTRRDDAPPRATGDGARRSALLPTGLSLDRFGLFDRSRSGRSGVVRGSLFAFGRRRVPARRRTRRGRAERALVLVLRLRLLGPSRGPSRGRPRTRPGTRRPRPGSVPVPGGSRRARTTTTLELFFDRGRGRRSGQSAESSLRARTTSPRVGPIRSRTTRGARGRRRAAPRRRRRGSPPSPPTTVGAAARDARRGARSRRPSRRTRRAGRGRRDPR